MKKILILMTAAMPLFYSCSKNNEATPEKDQVSAEAKKLQTDILGKWEFSGITLEGGTPTNGRRITHPKASKRAGIKTHAHSREISIAGSGNPVVLGENTGYIEFLSDSTYLILDADGNFFQGKFNAVAGDSISLGKLGTIGGIKLTNSQLNFNLYYSTRSQKINIISSKIAALPTDTRTSLLCRSWYLTPELYGAQVLGDSDEVYNEATSQYDYYIVDSLGFTITTSGTFIIQDFSKGKLVYIDVDNWKWHSTKQDTFVFYTKGEEIDEDKDFFKITSLTSSIFKCSQFDDVDENGTVDELKLVFKPAR